MPGAQQASIRAFVALDLDAEGLRVAAQVADRLRGGKLAPNAAWTAAEKMHVTVKFAGELPAQAEEPVKAALGILAQQQGTLPACSLRSTRSRRSSTRAS